MTVANDYACVWIEEGIVYAGIKRVYDYDDTPGYIIKIYGMYHEESNYRNRANVYAICVASNAGLPVKMKWSEG